MLCPFDVDARGRNTHCHHDFCPAESTLSKAHPFVPQMHPGAHQASDDFPTAPESSRRGWDAATTRFFDDLVGLVRARENQLVRMHHSLCFAQHYAQAEQHASIRLAAMLAITHDAASDAGVEVDLASLQWNPAHLVCNLPGPVDAAARLGLPLVSPLIAALPAPGMPYRWFLPSTSNPPPVPQMSVTYDPSVLQRNGWHGQHQVSLASWSRAIAVLPRKRQSDDPQKYHLDLYGDDSVVNRTGPR